MHAVVIHNDVVTAGVGTVPHMYLAPSAPKIQLWVYNITMQ